MSLGVIRKKAETGGKRPGGGSKVQSRQPNPVEHDVLPISNDDVPPWKTTLT
eukprot:CAMPEP_0175922352 /NCGR_PEP_ID=MMETSP0108-20121206/13999_1 /TAXON_ID=195067 ORGANISM="Goniomonas pacifica, Strain CCMP1869" /NCGR_SAMPLE_ID=MMETSP0108 /ASSEMBLY_ACC=CAM_ASM_000204 /LENGTH=51 /DNA_ID=CAMNT_0017245295 /DNA_START=280 /DNA_END=431 /DNA_ORIENTATION=+